MPLCFIVLDYVSLGLCVYEYPMFFKEVGIAILDSYRIRVDTRIVSVYHR